MQEKEEKVVHLKEGSDAFSSDMRRRDGAGRRMWKAVEVVGRRLPAENSLDTGISKNLGWSGTERAKSSRNGRSTAGRCTGRRDWRWGP